MKNTKENVAHLLLFFTTTDIINSSFIINSNFINLAIYKNIETY